MWIGLWDCGGSLSNIQTFYRTDTTTGQLSYHINNTNTTSKLDHLMRKWEQIGKCHPRKLITCDCECHFKLLSILFEI